MPPLLRALAIAVSVALAAMAALFAVNLIRGRLRRRPHGVFAVEPRRPVVPAQTVT